MNKFMLNIKIRYDTFSKSEKKIADVLLQKPDNVLSLYISDFAKVCKTSEATIVRFAKHLGFDGYQQFKIAIAQEAKTHPINERIKYDDSAAEIFQKVCEDIYCSLEKTKKTLNGDTLEKCCQAILNSNNILVFGLGNSASIAIDASHKMFRLGLNVHAYTDNHLQAIAAAHTDQNSVIIGISHSGRSKDIIQAMETAKLNGATTIAITNLEKAPIDKASDLILHTVSDETNYRILGLCSRISQLAIIDTVYSYIVCHLQNASEQIAKTELALKPKKV